MNELGGFTFIEFYELLYIIFKSSTGPSRDSKLREYIISFHALYEIALTEDDCPCSRAVLSKIEVIKEILSISKSDNSGKPLILQLIELILQLIELSTGDFFDLINEKITELYDYNKFISKIIDFLDGQKIHYGSGDTKLTSVEKTKRGLIFTEILNYYYPDFENDIRNTNEWQQLYTSNTTK